MPNAPLPAEDRKTVPERMRREVMTLSTRFWREKLLGSINKFADRPRL